MIRSHADDIKSKKAKDIHERNMIPLYCIGLATHGFHTRRFYTDDLELFVVRGS